MEDWWCQSGEDVWWPLVALFHDKKREPPAACKLNLCRDAALRVGSGIMQWMMLKQLQFRMVWLLSKNTILSLRWLKVNSVHVIQSFHHFFFIFFIFLGDIVMLLTDVNCGSCWFIPHDENKVTHAVSSFLFLCFRFSSVYKLYLFLFVSATIRGDMTWWNWFLVMVLWNSTASCRAPYVHIPIRIELTLKRYLQKQSP